MFSHTPLHLNNPRWMSNLIFDKDKGRQNVREKLMGSNTSLRTVPVCYVVILTLLSAFMTQGFRAKQMFDTFGKMAESELKQLHRTSCNLSHASGKPNVNHTLFGMSNSKHLNLT